MPIRTLNYTGRKKIMESDIQITITSGVFNVELNIGEYGLPGNARVFVEPYKQQHRRHIDFGTIGSIITPPEDERKIDGPLYPETVMFRIKVVDKKGKILANAIEIRPEHTKKSLLHIMSADIGDECWRLDLDDDDAGFPVLEIHQDMGDWRHVAKTPYFKAFVYPAIVRQVLTHILLINRIEIEEGEPYHYWLVCGSKYAGRNWPDNHNEIIDWVDAAVNSFARERVQALENGRNITN